MTSLTNAPDVTIVIPAKNAAHDLPDAFASIRRQRLEAFEVIVADDGSTDGTAVLMAEISGRDPRIRRIETGGVGPAAARNVAIEQARAPLIAFLDADDRWTPGKLDLQIAFHAAFPEATFSLTDYRHLSETGTNLGEAFAFWPRWRRLPKADAPLRLLRHAAPLIFAENAVGTATVVARRDALLEAGGFDPSLRSASDWDMWIKLALQGPVGYSTTVGMDYRMIAGSVTSNRALRIACMERIVSAHAASIIRMGDTDAVRAAHARLHVARAELARSSGKSGEALGHHLSALRQDPNGRVLRATLSDLRALIGPDRWC